MQIPVQSQQLCSQGDRRGAVIARFYEIPVARAQRLNSRVGRCALARFAFLLLYTFRRRRSVVRGDVYLHDGAKSV